MKSKSSTGKQDFAPATGFFIAVLAAFIVVGAVRKWRKGAAKGPQPSDNELSNLAARQRRNQFYSRVMRAQVGTMDLVMEANVQDEPILVQVLDSTVIGSAPLPKDMRELLSKHLKNVHSN